MKMYNKQVVSFLSGCVITVLFSNVLLADLQSTVNTFNANNYTLQLESGISRYDYWYALGELRFFTDDIDLSAYTSMTSGNKPGFGNYFQTFCIEKDVLAPDSFPLVAHLNLSYNASGAYTASDGLGENSHGPKIITRAVATVYRDFVLGLLPSNLYNYTYGTSRADIALMLQFSIWELLGESVPNGNIEQVMTYLMTTYGNDRSWWNTQYNPLSDDVDNMGYSVLAVNMTENNQHYQDVLYLVKNDPSTSVPEPMTLGLWFLGTLAVLAVACKKRLLYRTRYNKPLSKKLLLHKTAFLM